MLSDEEDNGGAEEPPSDEQPEEPTRPVEVAKNPNSEVDDLWASLQKKKPPTASTPSSGASTPAKTQSVDDIWASLNKKPSPAVSPATSKPALQAAQTTKLGIPASWLSEPEKPTAGSVPTAEALPASSGASQLSETPQKSITITEKYDFAGETITLTKEVPVDSLKPGKGRGSPAIPSSGLGSILADMKGKKKLSALQKSALDWQGVREGDEDMKAELDQNKKDGYLEKQAFLSRTDWRTFENERDERSKNRKPAKGGSDM